MQTIRHCLTTTIGAILFAGAANAATITTFYNFGSVGTPLDSGVNFNGTLDFFNTSQGTLTNVEMKLTVTSVGGSGIGYSAVGAPEDTMDFQSTLTVILKDPTGVPDLRDINGDTPFLSNTSTITDVVVPGNGGNSGLRTFSTVTNNTGWVSVDPTKFSGFGKPTPSTFAITAATGGAGVTNFTTSGGTVETNTYTSPDYYGTIEVKYTFTPIPEPSAALLGGLGALMLLRRRR